MPSYKSANLPFNQKLLDFFESDQNDKLIRIVYRSYSENSNLDTITLRI